jgi:alcohol dehydrogenase
MGKLKFALQTGGMMQQLTYVKRGQLAWQEVPEPVLPGEGDVLVRPFVVARCDLDLPILYGKTFFRGPFPFGHEFIAEVVAIGEGVQSVQVGQQVIVPFQVACGACKRCQKGVSNSCLEVPDMSHYGMGRDNWGGALSDLVRVPYADAMLLPVPAGIDPLAIASASDNLPDAWRTVGPYLQADADQNVLIVGGGAPSIGLYAVGMAVALGAVVDYVDSDPDRLRLAEQAGANVIEGPPPKRMGPYSLTVDASADEAGLACALRSAEPGGICTSVGIYYSDTAVPLLEMYSKGITFVTGRVNAREAIPPVLDLVLAGRFKPEQFTTAVASWSDAPEAMFAPSTKLVVARAR